jgi:hypothetical protein
LSRAIRLAGCRAGGYVERRRGYFGIGAESISKPMNLGNPIRSAHAFGASFIFLVDAHYTARSALSDTSQAEKQLPLYRSMRSTTWCCRTVALIGVELLDEASQLPSFRHPLNAAYVFGPERSAVAGHGRAVRSGRADSARFCINRPPPARSSRTIACWAGALRAAAGALRWSDRTLAPARLRRADHPPAHRDQRLTA